MRSTSPRRAAASILLIATMVATLSACDVARVGKRCQVGFARNKTHLLVCKKGRWVQGPTVGATAVFLVELARRSQSPAPGTGTVPVTIPADPNAPTLSVVAVVDGLSNPWEVAFAPDATMLLTERSGNVDAVIGGVRRILAHPADVEVVGEAGMLGLAVDPAFASNRRIFTCFRSTISGGSDIRVVRWVVDSGYSTLTGRTDIVTGIPTAANHNGCRLKFGPDGNLWVTTGDATVGPAPQDPTSLAGKVLRVNTDGGPAVGNPGGGLDPRIFTRGHRNPQGLAFRPADGQAFSIEHGPDRDDEVNRLLPGGNYGWNPVPDGGTSYDQGHPMTDPRVAGALPATWSSGIPTIAPSGATFLDGAQWRAWDGALAIAVLKASQLRVLRLDAAGTSVADSWTAVTDHGRLRSAVQGPDGNLYLATDASPGQILRVTPS